ncbi:MAG: hypothetical protein AAGH90_10675 [Pseudomonadota bacterium]
MRLTIEPTGDFIKIEGARCRLWTGEDDAGTPVHVYVRCLSPQTHDKDRCGAFDAALEALPDLKEGAVTIDYRFVVD